MKPKEYLKKYQLSIKMNQSQFESFLNELMSDLISTCEFVNADDNINKFNHSVDEIRSKWDAISNKVPYGLSEGQWNYFYAKYIVPFRDELCPTWKHQQDIKHQEYLKDKEARERRENE